MKPSRIHVVIEALRRAYRDRAEYLGDPDFVDMPITRLINPYYADGLRASIRLDRATPSVDLPATQRECGWSAHHALFNYRCAG